MPKSKQQLARPRLVVDLDTPAGVARGNGYSEESAHVSLMILGAGPEDYSAFSAELIVSRSESPGMIGITCTVASPHEPTRDAFGLDCLKPHEVEPFFLVMAALRERAHMDGILPLASPCADVNESAPRQA